MTAASALPTAGTMEDHRPLIAHVVHRLDVGGLENGLVNVINGLPESQFRHAVIALTEVTEFRHRIRRADVPCHALHKREGKDPDLYRRLFRLFRALRPDLVHTRNLATLEAQLPAWLAGVPARVHGEHGWDVADPHGARRRYRLLRAGFRPLVQRYVPLSRHIEHYLLAQVGVPYRRITRIYNGVDAARFAPRQGGRAPIGPAGFAAADGLVIGWIGRMQPIKDPLNLVDAFLRLRRDAPQWRERLRLVMIGDGPLRAQAQAALEAEGCAAAAWLPGSRDDIPALLRGMDLFVLPSRAEGISNTILEAMASALPVVATSVGGNDELVVNGSTGCLVPAADSAALADGIAGYLRAPERLPQHGQAGRQRVERKFTLSGMVDRYGAVYRQVLEAAGRPLAGGAVAPAGDGAMPASRGGDHVRHRGRL